MGKLDQSRLKQNHIFRTSRSEQLDNSFRSGITTALPQLPHKMVTALLTLPGLHTSTRWFLRLFLRCSWWCCFSFCFRLRLAFAAAGSALFLGSGIVFWRDSRVKLSWPLSGRMGKHEGKNCCIGSNHKKAQEVFEGLTPSWSFYISHGSQSHSLEKIIRELLHFKKQLFQARSERLT